MMEVTVKRRKSGASKRVAVTIRLPAELVMQIDQACDLRQIPVSRNNWFMEAVVEKLERTNDRGTNGTK